MRIYLKSPRKKKKCKHSAYFLPNHVGMVAVRLPFKTKINIYPVTKEKRA